MAPPQVIKSMLLPKADRIRVRVPRNTVFLGISLITDEAYKKALQPTFVPWDSPEWPVLSYMHAEQEKGYVYHTFLIYPTEAVTEPLPLRATASFTLFGWLTFHMFEVPDDQSPPDSETTTTTPVQSLPPRLPESDPAACSQPRSSSP
jgi:hypothetical protein